MLWNADKVICQEVYGYFTCTLLKAANFPAWVKIYSPFRNFRSYTVFFVVTTLVQWNKFKITSV